MEKLPVVASGLLDVDGAATYLGVSVAFIRKLVLEKRVTYHKVGALVRFKVADLDAMVDAGTVQREQEPVMVGGLAVHPDRVLRSKGPRRPKLPAEKDR